MKQLCLRADSKEAHQEKYTANFPYPYMNGVLHVGHAFSLSKVNHPATQPTSMPEILSSFLYRLLSPCCLLTRWSLRQRTTDCVASGSCSHKASTAQECQSRYATIAVHLVRAQPGQHAIESIHLQPLLCLVGLCRQAEQRDRTVRQSSQIPRASSTGKMPQPLCALACFDM